MAQPVVEAEELTLGRTFERDQSDNQQQRADWRATLEGFSREIAGFGEEIVIDHLLRVQVGAIKGCYYTSEEKLLSLIIPRQGVQPYFWDLLKQRPLSLLKNHPWVRDAEITWKVFPTRLSISIEEFEPWLVADYHNQSWLVSSEGTLIEPLEAIRDTELILQASKLPRLYGLAVADSSFSSMKSPNARLNYALRYLQLLKAAGELPFAVERYTVLPQGGMRVSPLEFDRYPEVSLEFDSYEQARDTVQKLRIVLGDLGQRGELAKEIDLRFNRQAVVR
jgi:hypothetical protein